MRISSRYSTLSDNCTSVSIRLIASLGLHLHWLRLISCMAHSHLLNGLFVPLIADVSLCCGLKEDASEDQLQLTATAILERYKWLKAGELMLFFFNFKAGFYERFYSYFDPQAIIRSMKPFLQERNLAIDAYERDLSTYKGVPQ